MTDSRWIVAYDIACPKRLYRVARRLASCGTRLQWSVFDCRLAPAGLAALLRDIRALIVPDEDSVRLYPLTGAAAGLPPAGYYLV